MRKRITSKNVLFALPWPELPELTASKICSYASPQSGKKCLTDWIRSSFNLETDQGVEMHDQFVYILYDVINESVDANDRNKICLGDLPTTGDKKWIKAPYTAAEVAGWWNEAISRLKPKSRKVV